MTADPGPRSPGHLKAVRGGAHLAPMLVLALGILEFGCFQKRQQHLPEPLLLSPHPAYLLGGAGSSSRCRRRMEPALGGKGRMESRLISFSLSVASSCQRHDRAWVTSDPPPPPQRTHFVPIPQTTSRARGGGVGSARVQWGSRGSWHPGLARSWLWASLSRGLGLHGPRCPHMRNGTVGELESTHRWVMTLHECCQHPHPTPDTLREGRGLTEVWGSDPPMTAASPAASGPPSSGGNSLRLQVLLRLEHREWEEAQAWQQKGEGGGERCRARASTGDPAENETAGSLLSWSSQPSRDRP